MLAALMLPSVWLSHCMGMSVILGVCEDTYSQPLVEDGRVLVGDKDLRNLAEDKSFWLDIMAWDPPCLRASDPAGMDILGAG